MILRQADVAGVTKDRQRRLINFDHLWYFDWPGTRYGLKDVDSLYLSRCRQRNAPVVHPTYRGVGAQ